MLDRTTEILCRVYNALDTNARKICKNLITRQATVARETINQGWRLKVCQNSPLEVGNPSRRFAGTE